MHFLTSGRLVIPEAWEVQHLIYSLKTKFRKLYRLLEAVQEMEVQREHLVAMKALTPSELYSFPGMEALQKYLDKISGEARSLKEKYRPGSQENEDIYDDFDPYEDAFNSLESEMRALKAKAFPNYDEVHPNLPGRWREPKEAYPRCLDFQNRGSEIRSFLPHNSTQRQ